MQRSLVLLLALVTGGCYQPSIDRCRLACNANLCPDGLTCNALGRCANAMDDLCEDVPVNDAPPVDGDGMNRATVEVRDSARRPMMGVPVMFVDPAGTLITEVQTGADGTATAVVPIGSSATAIRLKGSVYEVTTFVDLWPNARVLSQFDATSENNTVDVVWSAAPNSATSFDLKATCFAGINTTSRSQQFQSSSDCLRTDVLVMTASGTPRQALFMGDQVPGAIDLSAGTWQPVRAVLSTITNRPGGMVELGFGTWTTPSLAMSPPIGVVSLPASANSVTHQLPMGMGLTAHFAFTNAAGQRSEYYERLDMAATGYMKNLATNVVLPFDANAIANVPARRLTWSTTMPTNVQAATPNVVLASLSFSRGTMSVRWHLIGRGNLIVSDSATNRSLTFPEIPGAQIWEPTMADGMETSFVHSYVVTPAAETGVRAIIEHQRDALRLFEVPELRSISHSVAL